MSIGYRELLQERDRLLEQYAGASGEERIRIIARLVVLDEELEKHRSDDNRGRGNATHDPV